MSLSARLSVAPTVKFRPFAICWVSMAGWALGLFKMIVGGTRSGWKPPGERDDSHAHPASADTTLTHTIATARPRSI